MARGRASTLRAKPAAKTKTRGSRPKRGSRAKMSEAERALRIELAAAFRIAYHLGWNDRITNHITAKLPDEPDFFLMNPHGLGWHEITASKLVKVGFDGTIVDGVDSTVAPAGFNFHSAILAGKPDVACVVHTHTTAGVVVSAMKGGLMILDQSGTQIHGQFGYHDFEGYASERDEAPRIIADLGEGHTLIMRNHGLLSVGRTIGEAFVYMRRLIDACDLQVRLMSTGAEINPLPPAALAMARQQSARRHGNRPYGEPEWRMYMRLAKDLYPKFDA